MNQEPSYRRFATGTFKTVDSFRTTLEKLLDTGIEPERLSILGRHDEVMHNFDGIVPNTAVLEDSPETPRESYALHQDVRRAIHILSESMAALGMFVVAGVSYAIGGPIGVASQISDSSEAKVETLLNEFVDKMEIANFTQSLEDGGLICWVECWSDKELGTVEDILKRGGGHHVHSISSPGTPV